MKNILILATVWVMVFFLQLLCFKAKSKVIQFLPLCVPIIIGGYSLLCLYDFGPFYSAEYSALDYAIGASVSGVLAGFLFSALIPAWLYHIIQRRKNKLDL